MSDFKVIRPGQIVEGEVISVKPNVIYVDIKAQAEGIIYLSSYDKPAPTDFTQIIKVGDKVKAKVSRVSERDDSFEILLTRLPLLNEKKYDLIEEAYKEKTELTTTVKSFNEKGLILNYDDVEIFLPFTLLDFELKEKKESLKGTELNVLIEEYKPGRRPKIIATRKPIYERLRQEAMEKRQQERQAELDQINTGDILEGTVESFETHAAFVRFKHVSGMLRISQVSHYRIDKIEDALKKGDKVTVKVIKKEGNRLDLSMKALQKTPYQAYIDEHKVGETVKGKIVSKLPFGVLVELARDVKGLLHKNEYSWNPKDNFDAYLKIGDEIEVVIISKDAKKEKIALSKKAIEHNPWAGLSLRVGEEIDVRVESVTKDGLNISFESVDGFIPANEASLEKINIMDHFNHGDVVRAMVTEFSRENWVLKLSIRRLQEREQRAHFEKYLNEDQSENVTLGDLESFNQLQNKKKK
jgi:small subunit ribosomal protein S1